MNIWAIRTIETTFWVSTKSDFEILNEQNNTNIGTFKSHLHELHMSSDIENSSEGVAYTKKEHY